MTLRGPCGLNRFARLLGVSPAAVKKAIASGRLSRHVAARDARGRLRIYHPDAARVEWEQHTRPRSDVVLRSVASNGSGPRPSALAAATLRERLARAEAFEFEMRRKKREVVDAREVEICWSTRVVATRTALLGIPSRYRARLPHLTAADIVVLDGLIRETLVQLSQPLAESGADAAVTSPRGASRRRRAGERTPVDHHQNESAPGDRFSAPDASARGGPAANPPLDQEGTTP
jgi:phage terminase Nu1 subunit (DNA packaging protein)